MQEKLTELHNKIVAEVLTNCYVKDGDIHYNPNKDVSFNYLKDFFLLNNNILKIINEEINQYKEILSKTDDNHPIKAIVIKQQIEVLEDLLNKIIKEV